MVCGSCALLLLPRTCWRSGRRRKDCASRLVQDAHCERRTGGGDGPIEVVGRPRNILGVSFGDSRQQK